MIWDSANVQVMRSSQLFDIIVKTLLFFISVCDCGILSFSEKFCITHQITHNDESLTLMITLSTEKTCSGGQLKVEEYFSPLLLFYKREQKVENQTFLLGQQDKATANFLFGAASKTGNKATKN